MLNNVNWEQFLKRGHFLASPKFEKVWCAGVSSRGLTAGSTRFALDPAVKPRDDISEQDDIPLFYRNNFDCTLATPWISGDNVFEFDLHDFFQSISKLKSEAPEISWSQNHNANRRQTYEHVFKKIKFGIENAIVQKAVPFQSDVGQTQFTEKNLLYFFQKLTPLIKNKNLFFYGYWDFENEKLQFGASPELLFVKQGKMVSTIALAGTSTDPEKDFQNTKMRHEHDYVVTDLASELKKFGSVKKYRPCIVKYKNYFHKKTKLAVQCEKFNPSFEDLLSSLFPSAAIGAYPRAQGIQFLKSVEQEAQMERHFFAAPFGIQLNPDFMLCIATIRGIEWDSGTLRVSAGGGVVAQSTLDDEWREICLKIDSIKSILGLS